MDGLYKIHFLMKGHLTDNMVRGRLTRNKRLQDPTNYGQICGSTWLMHRNAKRGKNGSSRKPKLHNARRFRGIFFIDPDDVEFKRTVRNARRKLEVPMPAAMPCKIPINGRGETLPQYHCCENNYRFDALQTNCFGINIKL